MKPFVELGDAVELAWERAHHAEDAFTQIAAEQLAAANLPGQVSATDVLRWGLTTRALPAQHDVDATFGQPPLTVFAGRRFAIMVLFWLDGTTTIHQHSFSGAFQVLEGSSVQARFEFEPRRRVNEDVVLGSLLGREVGLLRRGDIRPIVAGRAFIHSLFHLERPSATIVVRTYSDERAGPQYNYYRPGLAVNQLRREEWRERIVQLTALLERGEHPERESLEGALIERADPLTCFVGLRRIARSGDQARLARLVGRVQDPELADAFGAALHEARRVDHVISRRANVTDPGHRFFLALLMNALGRRHILELVAAYDISAPAADTIVRWVDELSRLTLKLQAGGQAWEPSVVGLPAADEPSLRALRLFLEGEGVEPPADLATAPLFRELRRMPMFQGLFS